jgi:FdhD protein
LPSAAGRKGRVETEPGRTRSNGNGGADGPDRAGMPDSSNVARVRSMRATSETAIDESTTVAVERPLTVVLDDQELVTLLCSPSDMDYLAIGYLFAEGFIERATEISRLIVDGERGIVRVSTQGGAAPDRQMLFKRLITSACGRGAAFYTAADALHPSRVESRTVVTPAGISALVDEFNRRSSVFESTGGVHSAALTDTERILVYNDDLGRHNAIDKVFGECIMKGTTMEGRLVITSGRTPSEMVLKAARGKVPILVSPSATTDLGIRLAEDLGITLVGFARGKTMTVYSNRWRVRGD